MQINIQPSIRPIPARRKKTGNLDAGKSVTSFEEQVQASNPDLKRPSQNQLGDNAKDDDELRGSGDNSHIDTTA